MKENMGSADRTIRFGLGIINEKPAFYAKLKVIPIEWLED